jgi:hypothetical protein
LSHSTRATWTDERLDDLSAGIEGGFELVDRDIRELRGEIHGGLAGIDRRFTHLDERIDGIQRSINRFGAAVVLTF